MRLSVLISIVAVVLAVAGSSLGARKIRDVESISFEAELANLLEFPFQVGKDGETSGGKFIEILQQAGNHGNVDGEAAYIFKVARGGNYTLWLRVWWLDSCANSFFVVMDNGERIKYADEEIYKEWHWVSMGNLSYRLLPGEHRLRILNREDGAKLDEILLIRDPLCLPGGIIAPNQLPKVPAQGRFSNVFPPIAISTVRESWVILPQKQNRVTVYLRRNTTGPLRGRVTLGVPSGVRVLPSASRSYSFSSGGILREISYRVAFPRKVNVGEHPLKITVASPSGKVVSAAASMLTKPFDWWLIGPFDNTGGRGFGEAYPPEAKIDLTATYTGKRRKVSWKKCSSARALNALGYLDLHKALGKNEWWAVAYALTYVNSLQKRRAQFWVGSDDSMTIWLNGKKVFAKDGMETALRNEEVIPVTLARGKSEILLKVCQRKEDWGFFFRITDQEGGIIKLSSPD